MKTRSGHKNTLIGKCINYIIDFMHFEN